MRLLLYQHILVLIAVEPQTDVGTSFLENLQKSFLHLRVEEELAILCLVETALAEGGISPFGICSPTAENVVLPVKKTYSRFYPSPFTFSLETPINTGVARGEGLS